MLKYTTTVCILFALLIQGTAGIPAYANLIPNGKKVPGVTAVGHVNPNGGSSRNKFGQDWSLGNRDWGNICNLDSDEDGFTNAQELGSACNGTILRTTGLSNPGDKSSVPPPSSGETPKGENKQPLTKSPPPCLPSAPWKYPPHYMTILPEYGFSWFTNKTHLTLALTVDSGAAETAPQWLGFGISESGSMVGSDLVTVEYDRAIKKIRVRDHYVPWAKDWYQPVEDDTIDWQLLCQSVGPTSLRAVLVRAIDTGDAQDRPFLTEGSTPIIVAWGTGSTLSYHGARRSSTACAFFGQEPIFEIPADVSDVPIMLGFQPPFKLTSTVTQYVCQAYDQGTKDRHVVAAAQVYHGTPGAPFIHHMLLHACGSDDSYIRDKLKVYTEKPYPCQAGTKNPTYESDPVLKAKIVDAPDAEGISVNSRCETLILGTAEGTAYVIFPPEVGILIGTKNRFLILEVHVDNPTQIKDTIAITDLITIYTASKLRKYNAGTLIVGDPVAQMLPMKTGEEEILRHATCPGSCTSLFAGPITVFSSLLHMHKAGKRIVTTLKRPNEKASILDLREFYHFGYQLTVPTLRTIYPGDQLNTRCYYDTTKDSRKEVVFGQHSDQEMCMDFLLYYPYESAFKYCGFVSGLGTLCGGAPRNKTDIQFMVQPVDDGLVGFGKSPFGEATAGKQKVPAVWQSEPDPIVVRSGTMKTSQCLPVSLMILVAAVFILL